MTEPASLLARHVRELARHMAWADATVWNSVLTAPEAVSDAKIADTLHHIHLVQHIFVQAWTHATFAVRERREFPTLDEIAVFGLEGRRGVELADLIRRHNGVPLAAPCLREVHTPEQIPESRGRVEAFPFRIYVKVDKRHIVLTVSFFQPFERLILLAKARVKFG